MGPSLANHNTEMVQVSGHKEKETAVIKVETTKIRSHRAI